MLLLYRLYQILIMAPLMLVFTVLTCIVTILGSALGMGRWFGYYPQVLWSRLMCWLTLVSVRVEGRENMAPVRGRSCVFVCNHQGAYDIFSVYGWLGHNFRWMMKAPLRKIPLVGYACERSKQIFVDNSSPSAVKRTMEDAEKILSGGMSIVVFPEGARTWDGKMRPFKRGAYRLAEEFGLPVVPVTINGAFKVMPRFKKIPHWGRITLTIHPALYPGDDGKHDIPALMQKTHDEISSSLQQ